MYVCVCVYVCTCVHARVQKYLLIKSESIYLYKYDHHTPKGLIIWGYVCLYVCVCVCMCMCMCVQTCIVTVHVCVRDSIHVRECAFVFILRLKEHKQYNNTQGVLICIYLNIANSSVNSSILSK